MVDYSWSTISGSVRVGYLSPAPQEAATFRWTSVARTGVVTLAEGTINATGQNWNKGTISLSASGHAGLETINNTGTFYNSGVISGEGNNFLHVNGGSLVNSGEVRVCSGAVITAAVSGKGVMDFMPPGGLSLGVSQGTLELDGAVGSGQVVDMTNDGTLVLGDLPRFHAVIEGFTAARTNADGVVLSQDALAVRADVTSLRYSDAAGGRGVLKLLHGATVLGSVTFAERFAGVGAFALSHVGSDSVISVV